MIEQPQTVTPRRQENLLGIAEALRSLAPELTEWVLADFEYASWPGDNPEPHHLCATEIFSGRQHSYGPPELAMMDKSPFPENYGLISFAADAELSCVLVKGWTLPARVIDLRIEHMMLDKNVAEVENLGANLEEALAFYGMSHSHANKKALQTLCAENTSFTPEQDEEIATYCAADVAVEMKLLECLVGRLDRATLFRGRYMRAVSVIHHRGIPFDVEAFEIVRDNREELRMEWIRKYDPDHEIFTKEGKVNRAGWESYLKKRGLLACWPRTKKTHRASYSEDALRDMAAAGNIPWDITELFYTANLLKTFNLFVGADGRNRVKWMNAFGTKTGRNAQKGYIYMAAKWVRSLMKPGPGMAMAYLDWESMEVGVGAWLSQDPKLLEAYASGDAHMFLAKASGMVPQDATKSAKGTRTLAANTAATMVVRSYRPAKSSQVTSRPVRNSRPVTWRRCMASLHRVW